MSASRKHAVVGGRLPNEFVCWSRMQTEAGQNLKVIVARKELERRAGDGLFCWGIGNAPAVLTREFVRAQVDIDVIFSVMKSKPKAADVNPTGLFVWRGFVDANGVERPLPEHVFITSRSSTSTGPKRRHFALMCHSDGVLELGDFGPFDPAAYRNAGSNGAPIGASQVTALLRRVANDSDNTSYRINIRAQLTSGYWVKLTDPLLLSEEKRAIVRRWHSSIPSMSPSGWRELALEMREGASVTYYQTEDQPRLF